MNRRSFLGFLVAAPIAVVAAKLLPKPEYSFSILSREEAEAVAKNIKIDHCLRFPDKQFFRVTWVTATCSWKNYRSGYWFTREDAIQSVRDSYHQDIHIIRVENREQWAKAADVIERKRRLYGTA